MTKLTTAALTLAALVAASQVGAGEVSPRTGILRPHNDAAYGSVSGGPVLHPRTGLPQQHNVAPTKVPRTQAEQVQAARDALAWEAQTTKGGPQQELLMEERRLDGLIDDLEHGRPVAPSDIDRALER